MQKILKGSVNLFLLLDATKANDTFYTRTPRRYNLFRRTYKRFPIIMAILYKRIGKVLLFELEKTRHKKR